MLRISTRLLRRLLRREDGAFQIEFAFAFPVLLLLSLGLFEFSLVAFDYQRAAEASRRAVRFVIIGNGIANTANLLNDPPPVITCTSSGGTVSCTNASPAANADANFQAMLASMQDILPSIGESNVRVTYESTDVGGVDQAGGIIPLVTIEIVGLQHEFATGGLIGVSTMQFPPFTTSVLGSGRNVNAV